MRQRRLLNDRGSAPAESIFAIVAILTLALGIVQVALTLYARNVVLTSAHEGARAAVELGRSLTDAQDVAEATVRDAVGGLVDDIEINVVATSAGSMDRFEVVVNADLRDVGIVPVPISVTARSVSVRPAALP